MEKMIKNCQSHSLTDDENQHSENKRCNDNESTRNNSEKLNFSSNELKKNGSIKYLPKIALNGKKQN